MKSARHAHQMPFGAELRDDGVAFRLWAPSRERAARCRITSVSVVV